MIHPSDEDDMPSLWENPTEPPAITQIIVSPPTVYN